MRNREGEGDRNAEEEKWKRGKTGRREATRGEELMKHEGRQEQGEREGRTKAEEGYGSERGRLITRENRM